MGWAGSGVLMLGAVVHHAAPHLAAGGTHICEEKGGQGPHRLPDEHGAVPAALKAAKPASQLKG